MTDERLAFGLRIRSELELPELAPEAAGEPDVEIRIGGVPAALVGAVKVKRHGAATASAFLFEAPGIARYLVEGGRAVTIEPALGAEASHVRTYLLGSVIGALCYQRGIIPLHANALELGGRCVALAGDFGAGKSTLAAHLSGRGWRVMGDDVCALSFGADGRVTIAPGARRFKLWADAMAALGHDTEGLEKVVGGRDKYVLPHQRDDPPEPALFRRLYVLAAAPTGQDGTIQQLSGKAAFEALMANVYRPEIAVAMGRRAEVFARAIETLRQASVFTFARRWGLDLLAEEADLLERHVRAGT